MNADWMAIAGHLLAGCGCEIVHPQGIHKCEGIKDRIPDIHFYTVYTVEPKDGGTDVVPSHREYWTENKGHMGKPAKCPVHKCGQEFTTWELAPDLVLLELLQHFMKSHRGLDRMKLLDRVEY